jgi:hypothetical protein
MNAKTSMKRNQDSRRQDSQRQQTKLENCYGEIGISAVAAAVGHCERERREPRAVPYDRD